MLLLNKPEILRFIEDRREFFDAAGRDNPFASTPWLLHFVAQIAREEWRFVIPHHLGEGESLMLLYTKPQAPSELLALTNYYASLYSPLISSAPDRIAAVDALVRQISECRPRFAAINCAPLDNESPDTVAIRKAFSARGWYVKNYSAFGNWYLPCEGLPFRDYIERRDSIVRNTLSRKSKKFVSNSSRGPDRARLEVVTDPNYVDVAMDAYDKVYAKSWKKPEPYPDFVRGWARICAQRGWLRLGLAWFGDTPIAAQFWFIKERRAYIFKLAYDEGHAKLSAGTVLSAFLFEHALDRDGVIEVDYLTGDDPYKRSWMTHRRERVGMLACNLQSPRGVCMAAAEYGGLMLHRWRGLQGRISGRSELSTR
jgi:hypothetical protein